jgi:hypothetical protein
MLPKIKRAREWLLAEAASDVRRLKTLWRTAPGGGKSARRGRVAA